MSWAVLYIFGDFWVYLEIEKFFKGLVKIMEIENVEDLVLF